MKRSTSFSFNLLLALGMSATLILFSGCRGDLSEKPPIHPNWNMDNQKRFDPQEPNSFFLDQRAMRPLVKGTVARGFLQANSHFYTGKVGSSYAKVLPKQVKLNKELLKQGKEQYRIFCTPCHGANGDGKGAISLYAPAFKAANLHDERRQQLSVGEIFEIITKGSASKLMPGFKSQISHKDRWAVISYVRALQLTRVKKK